MKTVICHFYNEEWLLPWWLEHHSKLFNHGIMIDYHSTDNSVNLIKQYCPTWDIVTSRNPNFQNARAIDSEVEYYEHQLSGWRLALNVTEFLYGTWDDSQNQWFVPQYVFVDMGTESQELDPKRPIYEQRRWGYSHIKDYKALSLGSSPRPVRSLHNYSLKYPLGRHFWDQKPNTDKLAIFYYGWASMEPKSIQRRMQIQTQIPNKPTSYNQPGGHHVFTEQLLLERFRKEQQPLALDLSEVIDRLTLNK